MSLTILNPDGTIFGRTIPQPSPPRLELPRNDAPEPSESRGFNDVLRESSDAQQAPQRSESAEPADVQPRGETQQDEQSATEQTEQAEQDTQASDTSQDATEESADNEASEQTNGEAASDNGDEQAKETSEEAQLQAAANAASAQLNVIDAVVKDQSKDQVQATTTQQIDVGKVSEVASKEKAIAQNQSGQNNLALNASLPNQSQSATGPATQGDAVATVQPTLQPGEQSQTNSGDTRGESKYAASTTTTTTASSTNSNAAATTAFAVSEQAGGDARLPINTTATTPTADAARQVQAQSAINSGDNDSLNTARLTRGLANAVQQRGGAVTLRLTPPEMGTVRISMQITGTSVSASFHAESASAQTLLTNQLAQLRSSLESKGMSVERLSVQPLAATTSTQNANQSQNQSDAQQQGQSQQQAGGDGRSRGQFSGDNSGQQSPDQQDEGGSSQQARRGFFDRLNDAAEAEAA